MITHKSNKAKSIRYIKDTVVVLVGIFSASIGLECFLVPNALLDGGVTGISLLSTALTGVPVSIFIFLINIPFIILGYITLSKKLAIKALLSIAVLSVVLAFIHFPVVTKDKLLIAVFGGFFLGAGIGLAVRAGSVLDGTEILALYLCRKASLQIGEVILGINILIFLVAAVLINMETAMYSILTYLAASKTIDFVTLGLEEYVGVTIISAHNDKIRKQIIAKMGRGVTIYKGRRGLRGKKAIEAGLDDRDILYTIVTKLELTRLKNEVDAIDPHCFMAQNPVSSTKGGMIKERTVH